MNRPLLLLALLVTSSCTGGDGSTQSFSSGGTSAGFDGSIGGFGGSTGATGGPGSTTLSGDAAFTVQTSASFASGAGVTIDLHDGFAGCDVDPGASHAVHLDITVSDGGVPGFGSYPIHDGGAVEFLISDGDGGWLLAGTASAGLIVVNRSDEVTVGGNFDVTLSPSDGGAPSDLSGIFSAANCGF